MIKSVKSWVRRRLAEAGYAVTRFNPACPPFDRRERTLRHLEIELLFDVGANEGQYAEGLRRAGYQGRIISFEPLSGPFKAMQEKAASDPLWQVEQMALGRAEGWGEMNVASFSQSSSFLPMLPKTSEVFPDARYVGRERVRIGTLDGFCREERNLPRRGLHLKVDAQGYERVVLEGSRTVLNRISSIELELSLTPLYEGESGMMAMVQYLEELGFGLHSIEPGFSDGQTGQLLQADGIFLRS